MTTDFQKSTENSSSDNSTTLTITLGIELTDSFENPDVVARVYYPDEGNKIVIKKGLSKATVEETFFHEIGHLIDWYLSRGNQSSNNNMREYIADTIESAFLKHISKA